MNNHTQAGTTELTRQQIYDKKERYYRRNFISLMLESFFFSFALTMFSTESVLPVYVSNLSKEPIYIAMIAMMYYGISYSSTIFSCVIGINAKSPKWSSVIICFLQRIGFFLILLSTFFVSGDNVGMVLMTFFVSLALYSLSAGMSSPLFAQMVSTAIHRNVGNFYGAYSLVGAGSGVLASLVLTRCLAAYSFPLSFRTVFFIGLLSSLVATVVVSVGVHEVTDDRIREKIGMRDILPIAKDILQNNLSFRNYTIVKMLLGAAEFAIPYYIITAGSIADKPAGFVGMMATVFLVAKMAGSYVMGRVSDRYGAIMVLRCSCLCGAAAALLAVTVRHWPVAFVMYALLAVSVTGIYMSSSVACVTYSGNKRTPIYTATVSLLCAPLYIIVSFGGAAIASRFSYSSTFVVALVVYLIGAGLTFLLKETA